MTSFKEKFVQSYDSETWDKFIKFARDLQVKLEYNFSNEESLFQALSIRGSKLSSNEFERLEFLGDSILNYIIGLSLYEDHSEMPPEELTNIRSFITKNETLAKDYKQLGIDTVGTYLGTGIFSEKQAADAFEALIGAITLDTGIRDVYSLKEYICKLLAINNKIEQIQSNPWFNKDPKSFLNEWIQKKYKNNGQLVFPTENRGSANAPQYFVNAIIKLGSEGSIEYEGEEVGPFSNKKEAEKSASEHLLETLKQKNEL